MTTTSEAMRRKRSLGSGWLSTLLGILVLVATGFALGLIVGVVSEEPQLVVGHVAGRSTQIDWAAERAPDPTRETFFGADVVESSELEQTAAPVEMPPSVASPLPPVAAAPPPGSVAAAKSLGGGERFAIQVGAFGEGGAAQALARSLRGKGYDVRILEPAGDARWRVRVGPLASRGEAEGVARRLKLEEHLPTWVLSEGG